MKRQLPPNFSERHQKAWAHKEVEVRGELVNRYSAALQSLVNTIAQKISAEPATNTDTSSSESPN